MKKYTYTPANYLHDTIARFEGKQKNVLSHAIDRVRVELDSSHCTVTLENIKLVLKHLNLQEYYDSINFIYKALGGDLPKLTQEQIEKIEQDFNYIIHLYPDTKIGKLTNSLIKNVKQN